MMEMRTLLGASKLGNKDFILRAERESTHRSTETKCFFPRDGHLRSIDGALGGIINDDSYVGPSFLNFPLW